MRAELSPGLALSYVSFGAGDTRPVLLLHAWGESRRSFERLLPLLARTLRAIAVDQRGHGDADVPEQGYALTDFARDVVAFMDALELPSAVLLGSSSGGYVAQQVAATWPSRVDGLVLVGSPRTLRGRPPFADEVDRLTDPMDPGWVRQSLAWFPTSHQVPASYLEHRVEDGARIPAHVWRSTFHGLCDALPPTDIATIDVPTLVVWGDRDDLLTRAHEEDLVRAIPGSRLVVYEDTGHLVLWEQPERLARDLIDFVEGLGPPSR